MPALPSCSRSPLFVLAPLLVAAGCASTVRELPASPPQPAVEVASASSAAAPPQDAYVPPQELEKSEVPDTSLRNYERQDIESWPRHRAWLYVGDAQSRDGAALTAGLRYGYFAYGNVGFGALVDWSDRDLETWVVALAVFARPTKHFQITVAPGVEFFDGDNEPLIRTGFEYGFDITEHLSIVPGLAFDVVSSQANVTNLGVSLQASF